MSETVTLRVKLAAPELAILMRLIEEKSTNQGAEHPKGPSEFHGIQREAYLKTKGNTLKDWLTFVDKYSEEPMWVKAGEQFRAEYLAKFGVKWRSGTAPKAMTLEDAILYLIRE